MDKKPTDAEIKKALECCLEASGVNCGKCPYCDNCVTDENTSLMMIDVLDLINRLQAANERLKNILICFMGALGKVRNIDDIENISQIPIMTELNKGIRAEIKAEAYKEFAERLKERASNKFWDGNKMHELKVPFVGVDDIDNLLKKLKGND